MEIVYYLIVFLLGIIIGFWAKNQLNESKNPLVTFCRSAKYAIQVICAFFAYCLKKIPKRQKKSANTAELICLPNTASTAPPMTQMAIR